MGQITGIDAPTIPNHLFLLPFKATARARAMTAGATVGPGMNPFTLMVLGLPATATVETAEAVALDLSRTINFRKNIFFLRRRPPCSRQN